MSSFNAWLSNEKFIIATDTLCSLSTSYGNVVKNFLTKVYHLPQYKCCFTSQGLRDFGLEFFIFIQKEVKANNLHSLLEGIKSFQLSDIYDEFEPSDIGTIFLFGLNDDTCKLEMYKIYFDKLKLIHIETIVNYNIDEHIIICKPQHENFDYLTLLKGLVWNNLEDIYDNLITITTAQKKVFDKDANPFIGGQIELTIMECSNGFYSTFTEILYEFDDYDKVSKSIMKNKK